MAEYEVTIDDKRCKGCGICVAVCEQECLRMSEYFNQAGYFYPVWSAEAGCTGCGACAQLCPDFAVIVYELVKAAG